MSYWLDQANQIAAQLVEIRRHLHMYPELGYREYQTSRYLAQHLRQAGIEVCEKVGQTGILATIIGDLPGPTIAFRADMDALPIPDTSGTEYASRRDGVCHACGHDAHCAILVGTGLLLQQHRQRLAGTVKLLFQPAEECPPLGGAQPMIADGVLKNPSVEAIYGLHVSAELPVGIIRISDGPMMAASDRARIRIIGRGGHGGAPQQTVDAVLVASHLVIALQSIVSRNVHPSQPAVLTVGVLRAGQRYNVVAETAELECTIRTVDQKTRELMQQRVEQVVAGVTETFGARYELEYSLGYPSASNSPGPVKKVVAAARRVMGRNSVLKLNMAGMGGEDFAHYLNHVPGAYFWLGSRLDDGREQHPTHHSAFDLNEAALPLGTALFCEIAAPEK
ncbi:MAG: M20 metallopeptidase family protein [Bacillota bacterium]|jgi:amidohydrolase